MKDVLLITGSHRANGNTAAAADALRSALHLGPEQVVDLRVCGIEPFRYGGHVARDGFQTVIERLLLHRQIIFATPVYWYAMSGLMKTFFDRLTDLLPDPEARTLGRSLAGRNVWVLATGTDEKLPAGFSVPFKKTAEYFSMCWKGAFYVHVSDASEYAATEAPAVRRLVRSLLLAGPS